jgi:chromatin remodeling complex protein RSC6
VRVNITRKQDEDEKGAPLSISIVGTPAELDAELPMALAEGYSLHEAEKKPVSVADQVKAQVNEASTESGAPAKPKRKAPAKKVVTPKFVKMKSAKPAPAPKAPPKKVSKPTKKAAARLAPDAALAAIVGGAEPMAHNEAMAKVWDYIKANNLKGKPATSGGTYINTDEKLKALFGKDKLVSSKLGKVVSGHMVASTGTERAVAPVPTPQITPLIKAEDLGRVDAPAPPPPAAEAPEAPAPVDAPNPPETPAVEPQPESQTAAVAKDAESLDLF